MCYVAFSQASLARSRWPVLGSWRIVAAAAREDRKDAGRVQFFLFRVKDLALFKPCWTHWNEEHVPQ
jgi:hypothetical protein